MISCRTDSKADCRAQRFQRQIIGFLSHVLEHFIMFDLRWVLRHFYRQKRLGLCFDTQTSILGATIRPQNIPLCPGVSQEFFLDSGFLLLDHGSWILDCEIWIVIYDFWLMIMIDNSDFRFMNMILIYPNQRQHSDSHFCIGMAPIPQHP